MLSTNFYFYLTLIVFCLLYYFSAGLAINIGYHRCLSHRSFKLWKTLKYIFVTLGLPAGTPIQWAGNHRFHHQNTDQPLDPHSPIQDGFWFAHVGWYIGTKNPFICFLYSISAPLRTLFDGWNRPRTNQQYNYLAEDISVDRYFRFISKPVPYFVACWLQTILFFGIAVYLWGWIGFIALWLMLLLIYNLGDSIDSVAHLKGRRPYAANHFARNNAFLGILTFGEGWHANHHVFPSSAKHGLLSGQFDLIWYVIRVLEGFGMVHDVKVPSGDQIRSKLMDKQQMGDIEPTIFSERFDVSKYDSRDPDPWLALFLDRSIPIDDEAKAAMLISMSSRSREFFLPLIKPFLWTAAHLIVVFRLLFPKSFTSSKNLHKLIRFGLKNFVSPEANFLILRHFHIGSELLEFISTNVEGVSVELNPLRPTKIDDVLDDIFLKHDLNIFNFIINLNTELRKKGLEIEPRAELNFDCITDGDFGLESFPDRWLNFIDVQSAIEIYTPVYQLFLTERDFWRASNSLQLDETIGLYVSRLLGETQYIGLINNKHPLVPLPTIGAGYRLVLHGLAAEALHATLRDHKRNQAHS